MKVEDFEKAIDALQLMLDEPIVIDEMVLGKGGQVKVVYGHIFSLWVKWDTFGRCLVARKEEKLPLEPIDGYRTIELEQWEHYEFYDLKIE